MVDMPTPEPLRILVRPRNTLPCDPQPPVALAPPPPKENAREPEERQHEEEYEVRRILSRPASRTAALSKDTASQPQPKSLHEREEEYAKARQRIFNTTQDASQPTAAGDTASVNAPSHPPPPPSRAARRGELAPEEVHEYTRGITYQRPYGPPIVAVPAPPARALPTTPSSPVGVNLTRFVPMTNFNPLAAYPPVSPVGCAPGPVNAGSINVGSIKPSAGVDGLPPEALWTQQLPVPPGIHPTVPRHMLSYGAGPFL